jgi:hypothetical protein
MDVHLLLKAEVASIDPTLMQCLRSITVKIRLQTWVDDFSNHFWAVVRAQLRDEINFSPLLVSLVWLRMYVLSRASRVRECNCSFALFFVRPSVLWPPPPPILFSMQELCARTSAMTQPRASGYRCLQRVNVEIWLLSWTRSPTRLTCRASLLPATW